MRNRRSLLAAAVFLAAFGMAAARAWTSDDAFITFRVVDQFLAGHGPVYNIGERVQVFTHPLWFLLLCAWRAAGPSLFPGAMALSLALFAAGLAFLYHAFRDKPVALAVVGVVLFFCRSLVDFATSGLETPLTFVLFAAAIHALRAARSWRAVLLLALLPLNRLDLLPWALPFVWIAMPTLRARVAAAAVLATPAALWAVFSTFYYGAPLPNTALAKLAGGPLAGLDNGFAYLVASLVTDPGAAALFVVGVVATLRPAAGVAANDRRLASACGLAAGIDVAYVLWCGGDFMLGRFLLPALWALLVAALAGAPGALRENAAPGAAVAARAAPGALRFAAWSFAVLGVMLLAFPRSTTALAFDMWPEEPLRKTAYAGALDERLYYLPWLGAYSSPARSRRIVAPQRDPPTSARPKLVGSLGIPGIRESLEQPLVDFYGLADPLLARVTPLPNGRPGHGYRPVPHEFTRWREPGHVFGDATLDALAPRLRLAHLDPDLWSLQRLRAIAWLAFHRQIDLHAVEVSDEGADRRIVVQPHLLFDGAFPIDRYQVWMRVYDARVRRAERTGYPEAPYDLALDRDCHVARAPADLNYRTTIEVPAGQALVMRCPKAVTDGDGILMRVGALAPGPAGPTPTFDMAIIMARPAFVWWADALPGWLADPWKDDPWPALGAALALWAAAGVLASRARSSARAAGAAGRL